MSGFFDISAPPQSLESLDVWGALDSLPASLDSELWRRAGLYGLRIAEVARASGRVSASRTACLAGRLSAGSGGVLRSSVRRVLAMHGPTAPALRVLFLRLRPLSGGASARMGGGLLGVGALYLAMGGEAATASFLHGDLTVSVVGLAEGRTGGGLGLNFGRTLALYGGVRADGVLLLRFKGWDWKAAPLAAQSWTPSAHITQLWHEPEQERRSAWR